VLSVGYTYPIKFKILTENFQLRRMTRERTELVLENETDTEI